MLCLILPDVEVKILRHVLHCLGSTGPMHLFSCTLMLSFLVNVLLHLEQLNLFRAIHVVGSISTVFGSILTVFGSILTVFGSILTVLGSILTVFGSIFKVALLLHVSTIFFLLHGYFLL